MELKPYTNENVRDHKTPKATAAYQAAIAAVRRKTGKDYPLLIGNKKIHTKKKVDSVNPCNPREVIGCASSATEAHAELALETAWKAFETWKHVPVEQRVKIILKASSLIRKRRLEFNALLTLEVGKNYWEADAETGEAIDFLEYYARRALETCQPIRTHQLPGERDHAEYIPLGAGVSITPWNFPFAIFLGQVCAPILAGNTMIVKPAEDSSVVAAWAINLLLEAGLPKGVVNYLPGHGEVVGKALVEHPRTRFIAFTGSRNVGLWINAEAAKVRPGQKFIKRVSLELGGKDGMVVDETANLDAAADAAVAGAFGFAGQKCSALSRLIVVKDVYKPLLAKVVERTEKLVMGQAEENHNVNAVINLESLEKNKRYLALAPKEGKVVLGGKAAKQAARGYFVEPTIVADVKPNARLAQEEIFGPILAVIPVRNFKEAMHVVNDTDYGLTGGLFSRNQERLDYAERELHVGNLYLNRKITGAMVGCHPFGGFNLSGTDSKAGGPDYLLHFLQMKSIARKN